MAFGSSFFGSSPILCGRYRGRGVISGFVGRESFRGHKPKRYQAGEETVVKNMGSTGRRVSPSVKYAFDGLQNSGLVRVGQIERQAEGRLIIGKTTLLG